MKTLGICMIIAAIFSTAGCEQKKVQVDAPGAKVETGPDGTKVETPAADIEVKR